MRYFFAGFVVVAMFAMSSVGVGDDNAPSKKKGDADGNNDRKGVARWEWSLLNGKGKPIKTGTFTGHLNGTITQGRQQEQVGRYTSAKNTVDATITKGTLKGEIKMTLVDRKPVRYSGEHVAPDNTKSKIVVEIIND